MREQKKKEPDALHEPAVLTTKMLRETLSFGVGENDTHCLTWAVNDKTDTLTWIMLVVKDEALLKMCESHMPRVEQFAHMDEEEFEVTRK